MTSTATLDRQTSVLALHVGGQPRLVPWRQRYEIGSAAFWIDQTIRSRIPARHALGTSLREEFVACILGGYGITGPMTLAAFHTVRDAGLLQEGGHPSESDIEAILRAPLRVAGHDRPIRYRFARQRAERIANGLAMLDDLPSAEVTSARELRDALLAIPGVGMKTASWIARNVQDSDDLAVIDIHIHRAGVVAEVFDRAWSLPKHYRWFEDAFCGWAQAGGVRTADLDACVWNQMARVSRMGWSRIDNADPVS
jgi:thermostable 8-oxoguanine DNA glycosylase